MKIIEAVNFRAVNFVGTLGLTIFALLKGEISVFYMLYLFWWQALIEIIAVFIKYFRETRQFVASYRTVKDSLFLMGIYFVFIIVLFGLVFAYYSDNLIMINLLVMMFKNSTFNINIVMTFLLAIVNISSINSKFHGDFLVGVFSTRMIILHLSIILGVFIHFGSKHYLNESFQQTVYFSMLTAIPFLIIKTIFECKEGSALK